MPDPDECPTCRDGRYDRATGRVTLPNECCAAYFYGRGTWPYAQWVGNQSQMAPPLCGTPEEGKART
jgi:hypothetical protein